MKVTLDAPILLVGSVVLTSLGAGQEFGAQEPIGVSPDPGGFHVADLVGSSHPDVLCRTSGSGSGSVLMFESQGDGTFSAPQVIFQGSLGRQVSTADLDQDGDLDILLCSRGGGATWWHENLQSSGFGPPSFISSSTVQAESAIAVDFDRDGLIDVVVGGRYATLFRGLGSGQFDGGTLLSPNDSWPLSMLVDDLNADGWPDLVFGRGSSPYDIRGILNDGSGSPLPEQVLVANASHQPIFELFAADLDRDGHNDLIHRGWIYRSLGAGLFASASTWIAGGGSVMAIADVDGDGFDDALGYSSANAFSEDLFWVKNEAPFGSGARRFIDQSVVLSGSSWRAAVGDLDIDGSPDLVTGTVGSAVRYSNLHRGVGFEAYCPAVANSSGLPGRITGEGVTTLFLNTFSLRAWSLPTQSFGFFVASQTSSVTPVVPNSQGALCLAGNVGRFVGPGQIVNSSASGCFSLNINLNAMPTPTGLVAVAPGDTWYFQAWYRDANPTVTSNFTDAVAVTFQ